MGLINSCRKRAGGGHGVPYAGTSLLNQGFGGRNLGGGAQGYRGQYARLAGLRGDLGNLDMTRRRGGGLSYQRTGNTDYGYGDYGGGGYQPASYDYGDYGGGGGQQGVRNQVSYDYSDNGRNFYNIRDNFQRHFGGAYNNGGGGINPVALGGGGYANRGLG